jgi:hypothetical protein
MFNLQPDQGKADFKKAATSALQKKMLKSFKKAYVN